MLAVNTTESSQHRRLVLGISDSAYLAYYSSGVSLRRVGGLCEEIEVGRFF